jgi:hypothetical protein
MPKLPQAKSGTPLRFQGLNVDYSFWPAKKTTRWKLQPRLFVKDPWAILFEAVYRHKPALADTKVQECLSYLEQAEDYFKAAQQGNVVRVKPVLLYYSLLNLAKCVILVRNPTLDMARARHGLVTAPQAKSTLGDRISVKNSARFVNVFDKLMIALEGGTTASVGTLEVRHLLPQIVPGHRLWTYACQKAERFLAISGIECYTQRSEHSAWLRLRFDRGEVRHTKVSIKALIKQFRVPGQWRQVSMDPADDDFVLLEQSNTVQYTQRPIDCLPSLFRALRPGLWSTVTSSPPYRKYYVFVDSKLGKKRLPQWAAMYILFFYLSDLTRYRPQHFDRFIDGKYGPQIVSILDECPRQFLYLMASELLEREVSPAAIA